MLSGQCVESSSKHELNFGGQLVLLLLPSIVVVSKVSISETALTSDSSTEMMNWRTSDEFFG